MIYLYEVQKKKICAGGSQINDYFGWVLTCRRTTVGAFCPVLEILYIFFFFLFRNTVYLYLNGSYTVCISKNSLLLHVWDLSTLCKV